MEIQGSLRSSAYDFEYGFRSFFLAVLDFEGIYIVCARTLPWGKKRKEQGHLVKSD